MGIRDKKIQTNTKGYMRFTVEGFRFLPLDGRLTPGTEGPGV